MTNILKILLIDVVVNAGKALVNSIYEELTKKDSKPKKEEKST